MILFRKKVRVILAAMVIMVCALALQACKGGYSFSGTSISPDVKTVSIAYINNMAPIVYPPLSNTLTEALKDKFVRSTRLDLIT
jgi:ABC-type oligopeptide transport system substrate-binding subunit